MKDKAYSAEWRKEVMRMNKSEIIDMMERVMDERDKFREAGEQLCRQLKIGNATVTMPGEHQGMTYASNDAYREMSKLTGEGTNP